MSETARELIGRGLAAPDMVPGKWALFGLQGDVKELRSACEKSMKAAALAQFYARAAAVSDEVQGRKLEGEAEEFLRAWLKKG